MKRELLINAVHSEQKRMAIVDNGKLVEFNIQMAIRDPIAGNIYKGVVLKVERGLQAAFVKYGGRKDGFLPMHDVSPEYFAVSNGAEPAPSGPRHSVKAGQEVLVQVMREVSERKGALLTTYISLPGRYVVLLPNKSSSGISRKIEDEEDRKRLKGLMEQIKIEEGLGFIVRTAGMNRTKQELARDYQHLLRLWKEIQKKAKTSSAPSLIYQESNFGVRSIRDYFTSEIEQILVDDLETIREMRDYCKAVMPRSLKIIKHYKEKTPLFDKYRLEDQIRVIYQDRVDLKSGGYIIISPTEAMITIDVNSGRGSNKRNIEETAFKTNLEASEEIARQLRLRDLGGLIVIDYIDMRDRKHDAEVEKAFKKALSVDRARIQLARISKFGILELSRQKKQSTIQEISYSPCPFCKGRGMRPSLEYTALNAYRKIESQAVKGNMAALKVTLPYEVASYLLNQKRGEISKLENAHDVSIHVTGSPDIAWDELKVETIPRERVEEAASEPADPTLDIEAKQTEIDAEPALPVTAPDEAGEQIHTEQQGIEATEPSPIKKKSRRKPRHRRRKPEERPTEAVPELSDVPAPEEAVPEISAAPAPEVTKAAIPPEPAPAPKTETSTAVEGATDEKHNNPLTRLRKIFEQLSD